MSIEKQKVKQVEYSLSLQAVGLSHSYIQDEDNKPIRCQFKSIFDMKVGNETITKEVTNTVWINPEEPIFKEIIMHSQHIIIV